MSHATRSSPRGSFAPIAALLAAALGAACGSSGRSDPLASTPDAGPASTDDAGPGGLEDAGGDAGSPADAGPDAGTPACAPEAGQLTLYVIPPPAPLDWSTPNHLFDTAVASAAAGEALVLAGDVVLSHEIGHVNLELDCGADSFPLTGQTGGGDELQSGADGIGILFRDYPGSLNEYPDSIGDNADTVKDIAARQASGNLTRVTFRVNQAMCHRLKAFHDAYVAAQAFTQYDGLDRARRLEGAGCAIFAAAFVDVGGLMRRSLFTPAWARSLFIGSARFANTLGANPYYTYGSNLVARDANGVDWLWPKGVDLPAPTFSPILLETSLMDSWTGPEDAPFDLPGVTLPSALASAVPFTLYDPQLWQAWAEQVWAQASASGSATSLGVTWTASTVQGVHEIDDDATCVQPQTLGFTQDNDDLFKDSDAP